MLLPGGLRFGDFFAMIVSLLSDHTTTGDDPENEGAFQSGGTSTVAFSEDGSSGGDDDFKAALADGQAVSSAVPGVPALVAGLAQRRPLFESENEEVLANEVRGRGANRCS